MNRLASSRATPSKRTPTPTLPTRVFKVKSTAKGTTGHTAKAGASTNATRPAAGRIFWYRDPFLLLQKGVPAALKTGYLQNTIPPDVDRHIADVAFRLPVAESIIDLLSRHYAASKDIHYATSISSILLPVDLPVDTASDTPSIDRVANAVSVWEYATKTHKPTIKWSDKSITNIITSISKYCHLNLDMTQTQRTSILKMSGEVFGKSSGGNPYHSPAYLLILAKTTPTHMHISQGLDFTKIIKVYKDTPKSTPLLFAFLKSSTKSIHPSHPLLNTTIKETVDVVFRDGIRDGKCVDAYIDFLLFYEAFNIRALSAQKRQLYYEEVKAVVRDHLLVASPYFVLKAAKTCRVVEWREWIEKMRHGGGDVKGKGVEKLIVELEMMDQRVRGGRAGSRVKNQSKRK